MWVFPFALYKAEPERFQIAHASPKLLEGISRTAIAEIKPGEVTAAHNLVALHVPLRQRAAPVRATIVDTVDALPGLEQQKRLRILGLRDADLAARLGRLRLIPIEGRLGLRRGPWLSG